MPIPPEFVLRAATPADAFAIAAHRYPDEKDVAHRDPYAAWVAESLNQVTYLGLVAERSGEIVAGAGMTLLNWGPTRGHPCPYRARLVNVWTHAECRRLGLSRTLVGQLLEQVRGRGVTIVSLSSTQMSRHLYEQLGFQGYASEMLLKFD